MSINRRRPWTVEDEETLRACISGNISVSRISIKLRRSPGFIRSKITELGYRPITRGELRVLNGLRRHGEWSVGLGRQHSARKAITGNRSRGLI
jgi:hypothetical protein